MCALCGTFAVAGHWTDGGGPTAAAERQHRVAVANRMLEPHGLRLADWAGRFTLTGRSGKTAVIDHVGALWPAAERIAGRPLDPLDEATLAAIERP